VRFQNINDHLCGGRHQVCTNLSQQILHGYSAVLLFNWSFATKSVGNRPLYTLHLNKEAHLNQVRKEKMLRKSCFYLFAAALAGTVLTTGCQSHHDHRDHDDQPAQAQPAQAAPVQNETVVYNKWEVETHRAHKELNQRPADEQKEYQSWRQQHPDGR
jgi:hypothetical protein